MAPTPKSKPKLSPGQVLEKLSHFPAVAAYPLQLLGIRGYYKTTMGNPLKNDRGIYDDAIILIGPNVFATFNANTDPSVNRTGIATLVAPQTVLYKKGFHGISGKNPRPALRQASFGIKVKRDDKPGIFTDSAKTPFWINIHDGGNNTTSSEGCQTIVKSQWKEFLELVYEEMDKNRQEIIPYTLIEES